MAKLTLIIDSTQAEQALRSFVKATDGVTVATEKTVNGVSRIVRSLAALGLAYKTYDFARDALRLADTADRAALKFNVAFGSMSAQTGRWAKDVSSSLKVHEEDVQRAAANFQIMFENMRVGPDVARDMSKGLTELGAKLAIVNGLSAEETFGKLESGMMGNARALRELNITMRDNQVEQYALDQGWIEHGQTLSDTGRAYTIYRMILDQTAKATSGLSAANKSYGEQTRRLSTNIAEIKQAIGEGLKPAVTSTLTVINKYLDDNQSKVKRWASDFKEGVGIVSGAWRQLQDENQVELQKLWSGLSPNMQRAVGRAYESEKGEPAGFHTVTARGSMSGGAAIETWQKVSDPAYLRKLIEAYEHQWYGVSSPERLAAEKAARAAATEAPAPPAAGVNGEGPSAVSFADRRQGEAMLRDLRFQRELLHLNNIERETALALQEAGIAKSDRMAGAIEKEVKALENARWLRQLADDIGDAWGNAFERIIFEADKAGEAVQALIEDIARAVIRNTITQPISSAISDWIMGIGAGVKTTPLPAVDVGTMETANVHTGGIIGYDVLATRAVSPLLFAGAPRYHNGLFPGERPTILQDGETVLPRGSRPNVTLNITNNSSAPVTASVQDMKIDLRRMVVGIVLEDQQTNGPISRTLRR